MQCRSCGAVLPSRAAFCTNCGAATPYNISGQPGAQPAGPSQYQPIDPSSPPYSPPPTPQPGIAFTVSEAPSYGTPPPNPYGTPGEPGAYTAPPPPPTPYGGQYAPAPGSFIPPNQPPRRQGPNIGLIIGIVAIVVLLVAGGLVALL